MDSVRHGDRHARPAAQPLLQLSQVISSDLLIVLRHLDMLAALRLQAERGEHVEVTKYYQQIARDDLRELKKRLGSRTRMTITVPDRIHQRLSHVPTGLRSACVTRLLARGWLWESAYAPEEDVIDG